MSRTPLAAVIVLVTLQGTAQAAILDYELRQLSGPRADVAALILAGRESGALRVTGLTLAHCSEPIAEGSEAVSTPDSSPVSLMVEIEARSLLDIVSSSEPSKVPESVRVELYVYVMTRAGEIVTSLSKWVRLPLADLASRLPGGGVKLLDRLDLPTGEYQARVLVRLARSQQFALQVLQVTVPDANDDSPSISQPLFTDTEEPWVFAGRDSSVAGELLSALPILERGKTLPFAIRGCRLDDAVFSARLLTRESEAAQATFSFDSARRIGREQIVSGEIEIGSAQSGLHLLEVTAKGARGELTRVLPVFVAEAPGISTWTAIGGLDFEPQVGSDRSSPAETPRSSKRVEVVEREYRRALDLLAAGQIERSVAALSELEQRVISSYENPRKALKLITSAQNRVTADVLDYDPECLLPIIMLHLQLQRRYTAEGNVNKQLLNGSRTRIRSLAQVYATDTKQEMAAALAASSLVELATTLKKSGYLTSALIVLREALALDRANTDVLLDLAYQYEHHGFQTEALALLRRLLEIDPGSDEGRLRLAITLTRMQRSDEAQELLGQVIGTGSSEWVLAVAYQEMGQHLLRNAQFEDAVSILEAAVQRLPDVQRLRIQLAYALDRTGRRARGSEILSGLPADSGNPSPRLRYRVPEHRDSQRSTTELIRHGTARLPLLAEALEKNRAES